MAVTVVSDFRADLCRELPADLARDGFDLAGADLSSTDLVCFLYCNAKLRSLPAKPRQVLRSPELRARCSSGVVPLERYRIVGEIAKRAARGHDLRPFLHRPLTNDPGYNDGLLNEWNIFHFHLGGDTPPPGDRYVTRSGELLFGYVDRVSDALYLLDVRDHGAFADDELVEILHRNWAHVIARFRGPHMRGGRITPAERREARRGGLTPVTVLRDGTTYFPFSGGMSTYVRPGAKPGESGLSVQAVTDAHHMLFEVDRVERWLREERAEAIAARILEETGRQLNELHLELRLEPGGLMAIVETQTGIEVS